MEQNNLLEYLYKRLKNDKLWFVTKNDVSSSWENKPKKYYALDEYGEIKDKSKVEKEINGYIGAGAETIQEAVSLFIADAVCDGSITTTDYLTTEFKDKPVEYTDTAVEVKNVEPKYMKPEITGSNKQVESKQLKEDIFDDVTKGKAQYGVYDDKDIRNYKDRYKEPTYAKRNKIRNFKDDKFKQRSVRDIINKGVTHVDYEKMPNERVQAYKNSKKEENIQVFKKLDSNNLRHPELNNNVSEFYSKTFNDELKNDINKTITFLDVYRALKNKDDIYTLIGVGDSVIRERIFYELARILNQDPKYIYDLWQTGAYEGHPGIIKENVQRRLNEENNKSLNIISDMFKSKDFNSDSKAGQIVMRTSNLFNVLSDKGYDVQVSFDNGESTNTILLGQQGGSILITINNTNQPLRAFTDGSFEITEDNIKILDDVRKEIETI